MHSRRALPGRALLLGCALAAFAAAGCANARVRNVTDADAPRSLPDEGAVAVRWDDPARFSELRLSPNVTEARRGDWVEQLARHLRERAAARLPPGERLEVDILDIERAGEYEPWQDLQLRDVRMMRDVYPPRMRLRFRRLDAQGRVIAEGERRLVDPGYLSSVVPPGFANDPLRYEKAMIDRWLQRELR